MEQIKNYLLFSYYSILLLMYLCTLFIIIDQANNSELLHNLSNHWWAVYIHTCYSETNYISCQTCCET